MKQEHSRLRNEISDRQMRMADLDDKIHLAELCLLPEESQAQYGPPTSTVVASGLSRKEQQAMHVAANEVLPSSPHSADLTFSPSDQTLVERGQILVAETQRLPSITDDDVEMMVPIDSMDYNPQPPAGLENDGQEAFDLCNEYITPRHAQSSTPCPPAESRNRKRRRLSGFFSSHSSLVRTSMLAVDGEALQNNVSSDETDLTQQKPRTFRNRSRVSRILLGQLSALKTRLESSRTPPSVEPPKLPETIMCKADVERPVSYPQSQRWRKSLGVSVKSLTEGFERMRVKQTEARAPTNLAHSR